MKITYQSKNYTAEAILKRYVRKINAEGGYDFCEVGEDRRFDLRQGTVDADELPDSIRAAADEHYKTSRSYIDWPRTTN
jgi:hypothetical protein